MPEFIPGIELCESFFHELAKPVLATAFPRLLYSAGILGWSSEALGYDDLTSTDHNWGPRFQLFLSKEDEAAHAGAISDAFSKQLPLEFRGYATNFGVSAQGDQRAMARIAAGPVAHKIDIYTVEGFVNGYLGLKTEGEITAAEWLSFSEHKLLAVTSGKVFHDGLGSLEQVRRRFSYYPHDVWLYMLSAQWAKLGEEETFVGRCAEVGDDLGSRLIAARQVRNLMRLCFLMEKRYAPYSKWFGKAFSELRCAETMGPILTRVINSASFADREKYLSAAYETVARLHNDLGITRAIPEKVELHGRPYYVIRALRFAIEIVRTFESEEIKKIRFGCGSVNQLVNSDQQISDPALCKQLKELYEIGSKGGDS